MKIEDVIIGKEVVYTPYEGCPKDALEYGVITSKNDLFAFVRYGADLHSKATYPRNIEYV